MRARYILLGSTMLCACSATPASNDAATSGDARGVDVGASGADAGIVDLTPTPGPQIMLGANAIAMVSNGTTHRLYVSLRMMPGLLGAGIAVIDETTNTVTTTVPPPTPVFVGMPAAFDSMVVDETTNRVYLGAFSGDRGAVRVLDGATNTLSMIAAPDSSALGIGALAIDPAAHRLYAWVSASPNAELAIWDTQSGMLVTTVPITDLADGSATDHFGLDTTNHRLFVCGTTTASSQAAGCDTLDATTNTWMGAQRVFDPTTDGYFVGAGGGPGYAFVATNGTTSSPAMLDELEPARFDLPSRFEPMRVNGWVLTPDPARPPPRATHMIRLVGMRDGMLVTFAYVMSGETPLGVQQEHWPSSYHSLLFAGSTSVGMSASDPVYVADGDYAQQFVIDYRF